MKNQITECKWAITNRCNLRCIHCIVDSNKYTNELNYKEITKGIDNLFLAGCKNIHFTGGEPFERKDFVDIVNYCNKKNIDVSIISNGTFINKKIAKILKGKVIYIGISIDGSNPKTNDKIRGRGTFKKIINSINILKQERIFVIAAITLTKYNFYDLGDILNILNKLGVDEIQINDVVIRGRAINNKDFLKLKKNNFSLIKYIEKTTKNKIKTKNRCDVSPHRIFISSEGGIYPCIESYNPNKKNRNKLGDILDLNKKKLKKIQNELKKIVNRDINCPYISIEGKDIYGFLSCKKTCILNKNKKIK